MLPMPELVARLRALPRQGGIKRIAEATGIHPRAIRDIRNGKTQNPRVGTAQPLSEWLEKQE